MSLKSVVAGHFLLLCHLAWLASNASGCARDTNRYNARVVTGRLIQSGGQALAALGATGTDDGATTTSGHTGAKAVVTGTLQAAGLKSTLHVSDPCKLVGCGHGINGVKVTDTRDQL